MELKNLIRLEEICNNHRIDASFIHSLQETGLIEVIVISEAHYIESDQLPQLEKYIHFHYSLEINIEGIETITHLLRQIDGLQEETKALKNKLQFYQLNEIKARINDSF
jgi:hypothetical protein